ncbi:MAG: RNA methyltransferase [Gammaproteobacteria bacterium]|nr:MAG: RNA methyltransferase [Gammaproteobacteria bacterium]
MGISMQENTQLTHGDHHPSNKKFPLHILANNITGPLNVGSLFRLCDALGIEKLYLCGDTATPPNVKINKTSRSTEKHVDYESGKNAEKIVLNLKEQNFIIVSLEITSKSVALNSVTFNALIQNDKSICLIVGSESSGVSEALLTLSDITVHIPMHGKNSSMNVISAASIACYTIINQSVAVSG